MKAFLPYAAIAVALVAPPASGGQADDASRVGRRAQPAARADSREARSSVFRADFNRILDHYESVFRKLGSARGLLLSREARESFAAISDDTLARTFEKTDPPDLAGAVQAADELDSLTERRETPGPQGLTPGFPGAPPILGACDVIPHSPGFVFGALVVFQVVRTVLAVAEFTCLQTVVIAGEGGNTSLTCVPFATLQDLAAIPWELADFCNGEEDSVLAKGSYNRLEHIHDDIEAARAEIIANANANREIILAEMRNLACDLLRVVHTPDGQRASSNPSCAGQPSFPFNWPEHP